MRKTNVNDAIRRHNAEAPALEAELQVKAKYGEWVQSCIQTIKTEAKGYNEKCWQSTVDVINKYLPKYTYTPGKLMPLHDIETQPKIIEAVAKYPDFWSNFTLMKSKFQQHNSQYLHYAKQIRDSKNLQEADANAHKMQMWHDNLYGNFNFEINILTQKLDTQLKSVFQPLGQEIEHPAVDNSVHHQSVDNSVSTNQQQANQSETERLKKMIEDMQIQMNEKIEEARQKDAIIAQKDGVIAQKTQIIADKQVIIDDYAVQVTDLRQDKIELREHNTVLKEKIVLKDASINELNHKIEADHIQYKNLKIQFDELTIEHQQCHLAGIAEQHN